MRTEQTQGTPPRKIITQCVCPPIPTRNFDWQAYDANTYDGPGSPLGEGATEQEAIADLMEQLEERTPRASSVPEEGFEMALSRDELFDLCGKAADILFAAHCHVCGAKEFDLSAAKILSGLQHELVETHSWLCAMRWHRQPAEREAAA